MVVFIRKSAYLVSTSVRMYSHILYTFQDLLAIGAKPNLRANVCWQEH